MNTHAPSHLTALEQFQSGSVNYSAVAEYTARDNMPVPSPFPPASIPQLDDQPDGLRPRGYQRTSAQGQLHSPPMEPSSWNSSSRPPPEAASISRVMTLGQPSNQEEAQISTILTRQVMRCPAMIYCLSEPSPGEEIKLERGAPSAGGTVVEVRRDVCVTLRFDMAKISQRTSTECAGLKIPRTISVKNSENTPAHKLLGLRILVFGTTSGLQYGSICDDCQKKENRPGSLSLVDFRSKSDVVLPLRNSDDKSICISFSFRCYPKHYKNGDSQYRCVIRLGIHLKVIHCHQLGGAVM